MLITIRLPTTNGLINHVYCQEKCLEKLTTEECKLQPAAFKKWLKMTNNKLDAIEEQNKMMGLCSG